MQNNFRFWKKLKLAWICRFHTNHCLLLARTYVKQFITLSKKKHLCLGVLFCGYNFLLWTFQRWFHIISNNFSSDSTLVSKLFRFPIPIPKAIPSCFDSRFQKRFQLGPTSDSRSQVRYLEPMVGPLFDLVSKPGFGPRSGFKELWFISFRKI